ncbi:hypothetical protein [Nocardia salmonicida]|uniref:hypothetical protein n=1 Tax=Nocardia salmonicida TaxID=53431 RepID=UPI002E2E6D73|nr:hypothetical protein [Nocardia salmonicida]
MPLPDLTAREQQVAADECDTIAAYLDNMAATVDGLHSAIVGSAHRRAAMAVRNRAARLRELAEQQAGELYNRNAVTIRNPGSPGSGDSPFIRLP